MPDTTESGDTEPTEDGKPEGDSDAKPKPEGDPNAKRSGISRSKAANGLNVGWRPARTHFQKIAKKRSDSAKEFELKIAAELKARLNAPSKAFESTKEQDEARWKEFSEFTEAARKGTSREYRDQHMNKKS